jgi:hypothetical protein
LQKGLRGGSDQMIGNAIDRAIDDAKTRGGYLLDFVRFTD